MTAVALPSTWWLKFNPSHDDRGRFASTSGHAKDPHEAGEFTNKEWHNKVIANHDDWVARNAPYDNKTAEEWLAEEQAHVEKLVANADVYLRVRPAALESILNTGEVQTLFDGHSSSSSGEGTAKYKKIRGEFENDVFSVSPKAKGYEHPTYGYLANTGEHRNPALLDDYGTIAVRLKPSVRSRTTFTGGDSLDHGGWGQDHPLMSPTTLTAPTPYAFQADRSVLSMKSISAKSQLYNEAQVHGRVKVTDIERVHFTSDHPPDAALIDQLKRAGVEFEVDG